MDAVGGQVAINMANSLRPGSTVVVYGNLSRKAPTFPPSLFIFKDIRVKGFRLNRWVDDNPESYLPMIETLSTLIKAGKCKISMEFHELGTDWEKALERAYVEKKNCKILLSIKDEIGETYEDGEDQE